MSRCKSAICCLCCVWSAGWMMFFSMSSFRTSISFWIISRSASFTTSLVSGCVSTAFSNGSASMFLISDLYWSIICWHFALSAARLSRCDLIASPFLVLASRRRAVSALNLAVMSAFLASMSDASSCLPQVGHTNCWSLSLKSMWRAVICLRSERSCSRFCESSRSWLLFESMRSCAILMLRSLNSLSLRSFCWRVLSS